MVNYQNGKVYKIINENNEIVYIGSTTEEKLCRRYNSHKHKAPNHKIILIENYPCNSKEELCKREQQIIEEYSNLLNERKAYRSEEEKKQYNNDWVKNNKEYKKEYDKTYSKEYYNINKENENFKKKRNIYSKKHYENNKEYYNKKNREYYQNNKEEIKNNPEIIEYKKQCNEKAKNVKVKCAFCKCELRLDSLKRHQKSIKCMKFQECLSLD